MSEQPSSFVYMVQECQAAIIRVRCAIDSGNGHAPEVGEDLELIRRSIMPYFARDAKGMERLAPGAGEETQQIVFDRLLDHIQSSTYPTLTTHFGAYLKSTKQRVLQKTWQQYVPPGHTKGISRLDAERQDDGGNLAAAVADPQAEDAFASVIDRLTLQDAIAQLNHDERQIIALIEAGYTNDEIARQLAISPSTATRRRKRAVAHLQRILHDTDE